MNVGYSDFTGNSYQTDIRDLVFSSAINPSHDNPQSFYIEGLYNVVEWKLKSITIPLSFYLIRQGINDTISIQEEDGDIVDIVIEQGNYTPSVMAVVLRTALNSSSTHEYTVDYEPIQGKFIIESDDTQFRIFKSSTIAYEIGISQDSEYANQWVAPAIADFSGPSMIHLACSQLGTKSDLVGSQLKILASVPISNPPGGVEVYREGDSDFYKVSSHLSYIEFTFLDDHLRPLDIQGRNTVIVLTVRIKV